MPHNRPQISPDKLIRCPICEAVNYDMDEGEIHCHRCGSRIYRHPKISTQRTWAYLLTALLLYIPANVLPVMQVNLFTSHIEKTIIGGVILLWDEGSQVVAAIILIASVFVPILKFILLLYLLISVRYPVSETKAIRHRLYALTEVIGPWSMIDIFVVSILAGLVQFGHFKIIAGSGATAFVLMVFFTMLSALSFDMRLIKDHTQKSNTPKKESR